MNVIICLRDIAENPVTREGKKTTPISYDSNCLEEICGSCAMLINGKARMACSALVDKLEQPIRIEPIVEISAGARSGGGPAVHVRKPEAREGVDSHRRDIRSRRRSADCAGDAGRRRIRFRIASRCGSCLEVCPQVNDNNQFVGAAIISQVRLFNMHPTGAMHAKERISALMEPGGIQDCANAQNCVKACPKRYSADRIHRRSEPRRRGNKRCSAG